MIKIEYKLQGKGTKTPFDSWILIYKSGKRIIIDKNYDSELIGVINIDLKKVDVSELTEQQLINLIKTLEE